MEQVDNDSLVGLLDQLVQPDPPAPVSMLPQTWGWVVVGLLVLALLGYLAHKLIKHRRANAYRREALDLLDAARDDPARIAEILRRTALVAYPRDKVAWLTGEDWLHFLDHQIDKPVFAQGPGRAIATAPYRDQAPDAALTVLAANWIRHHSRGLRE
ncbi:DUF4381 domain-containing protein [Paracoccus sp. Z330]|uniref:DUF4381 domain-containing protein n=1 Tax=Paracoccus onchidii TaxID=3017813 RepID=A0ABT4ZG61_9RHOB|nr:DUF4381 domain-containing protein [Paracoccus onchidii]MDB6178361.1 DUF4381 domain-containing protein [Paracoccus onchidii]